MSDINTKRSTQMVTILTTMDTIMAKRRTVTTMILATHMITTNTTMIMKGTVMITMMRGIHMITIPTHTVMTMKEKRSTITHMK